MSRRVPDLSVYLVTDPHACRPRGVVETVRQAVAGGATCVQLRDKQADDAVLVEIGLALKAVLAGSGVPLIVNDRLEVAHAVAADGLHIGQGDGDPAAARAALGPRAILGVSIEQPGQLAAVDPAIVDYVGASPVYATATKPDHAPPLGLAGLAEICAASPVPVVAIGGLGLADVAGVLGAGAVGLAVVTAICAAADPTAAAAAFARAIGSHRAATAANTATEMPR